MCLGIEAMQTLVRTTYSTTGMLSSIMSELTGNLLMSGVLTTNAKYQVAFGVLK